MLDEGRRTLILMLALGLAGCAGAAPGGPAGQTSPAKDDMAAACRSYALPNNPDVVPPKRLSGDQPKPPENGPRSGYACVRVTISDSGAVLDPMVVKTDNQDFAQAFVRALSEWRYTPATRGSARVAYHTVLFARFPTGQGQ
jgi:Gram-negative bacterial TonB protein C-terminal